MNTSEPFLSRLHGSLLSALFVILFSQISNAQTYKERFDAVFYSDAPLEEVRPVLTAWEYAQNDDPDYYVAAHNYYFQASQMEVTSIVQDPGADTEAIAVTDTTGEAIGYIIKSIGYNDSLMELCLANIDKAIALRPNRLDMQLGKAFVLGETQRYSEQMTWISSMIESHEENEGAWLWTEGERVNDSDALLAKSIQDYISTLLLVQGIEEPLEELIEDLIDVFPNYPEFPNDLGAMAYYQNDLEEALDRFEDAYDDFPNHISTLNNLAFINLELENYEEALEAYQMISELATDPNDVQMAEEQIQFLKSRLSEN